MTESTWGQNLEEWATNNNQKFNIEELSIPILLTPSQVLLML